MNNQVEGHSAHRLGFMVPMILFVLMFVICCGVMVGLFVKSLDVSTSAGQLNDAVQLCRNQAERYRAGDAMPAEREYFDSEYRLAEKENAVYYIVVSESEQEQPAGILLQAEITAFTMQEEPLYTLCAARYVPRGR